MRKTWEKNWKIDIKFGVFISKRLERGWKVLVWEKVRALCNKKLPNRKKKQTWKFTKTLNSVMKEETWKKTPWEDFQEVFCEVRRLLKSLKAHYILEAFRNVFGSLNQIWETCISKPRSEKLSYPKTFKWLQKE